MSMLRMLLSISPFGELKKGGNVVTLYRFGTVELVSVLRTAAILACLICIFFSVIKLLMIRRNSSQYGEEKANIINRFILLIFISAAVFIFNVIKILMDAVFGL